MASIKPSLGNVEVADFDLGVKLVSTQGKSSSGTAIAPASRSPRSPATSPTQYLAA